MPIPTYNPAQSATTSNNLTDTIDTTSSGGDLNLPGTQNNSIGQGQSQNGQDGQQMSREEADRLYEERMEEEYAKREGGA